MVMTDRDVFEVVKRNIVDVMDISDEEIRRDARLTDLGANSLDRTEIVSQSMDELGLRFPVEELASVANIGELVSLLQRKLASQGG